MRAPAPSAPGASARGTSAGWWHANSARLALFVFVAYVIIAIPVVLFGVGSYHWFFRDDWFFITDRSAGSLHDLFSPHNAHWSTVPIIVFRALWQVVGVRSYVPYQAAVLLLHLTAAVLLRVIMRRAGVNPWIATAAASLFVLFGPGEENITWAFQVGFVGSLVFGLAALILTDHDGRLDRRDALGFVAALLALMSSSLGIVMAGAVGLAMLLRRGWRPALALAAPLAAVYVVWAAIEHPKQTPLGRPSTTTLIRWVWNSEIGTYRALGHFVLVALLLVALLVAGAVLGARSGGRAFLRRAAVPAAMVVAGAAFAALSGLGRAPLGMTLARSSRYLHVIAALSLPALALGADAIARRWRQATPIMVALFLVAIPWNVSAFGTRAFGRGYFDSQRRVLTSVVRVPVAHDVPQNVRPIPDIYLSPGLNIGWLLRAHADGKLDASRGPLPPMFRNQLRVNLGVSQTVERRIPTHCRTLNQPLDVTPARGTVYRIASPVWISTQQVGIATSGPVVFIPLNGTKLTIVLNNLSLRFAPPAIAPSFTLCG